MPSNGPMSSSTGTYTHMVMVINGFIENKFLLLSIVPGQQMARLVTQIAQEVWKTGFNANYSNVCVVTAANANPGRLIATNVQRHEKNTKDWTADAGRERA